MVNFPLERLCQPWNSIFVIAPGSPTVSSSSISVFKFYLPHQFSNSIFYVSLQILYSTSVFALLSPNCIFKLIKLFEKVQNLTYIESKVMFFCMTSTRLALNVSKKRFHFVVLNQRERMCSYHFKVHKCCSLCYSPKKLKKMPFLFVLFCHFFCQNRAIFLLLWLFPANVKSLPILFLPILCAKNVPSFFICHIFLPIFEFSSCWYKRLLGYVSRPKMLQSNVKYEINFSAGNRRN